jgi:hypothetical protein
MKDFKGRLELAKFRWGHLGKKGRGCFILTLAFYTAALVLYFIGTRYGWDCEIKYPSMLILFLTSTMISWEYMKLWGKVEAKYLKEMNEIRAKFGFKLKEI